MTFASQLSTDLAVFYDTDELAVAMTYTPASGSASSVTGVPFYGDAADVDSVGDFGKTARFRLRVSEVATPDRGETLTVGSDVWEILFAEKSADGLEWILTVSAR